MLITVSSLFGFLLGSVAAGSSVYTYLLQEYKTSNDLLSEDIYVRHLTPIESRRWRILCDALPSTRMKARRSE